MNVPSAPPTQADWHVPSLTVGCESFLVAGAEKGMAWGPDAGTAGVGLSPPSLTDEGLEDFESPKGQDS